MGTKIFRKGIFGRGMNHKKILKIESSLRHDCIMVHIKICGLGEASATTDLQELTAIEVLNRLVQRARGNFEFHVDFGNYPTAVREKRLNVCVAANSRKLPVRERELLACVLITCRVFVGSCLWFVFRWQCLCAPRKRNARVSCQLGCWLWPLVPRFCFSRLCLAFSCIMGESTFLGGWLAGAVDSLPGKEELSPHLKTVLADVPARKESRKARRFLKAVVGKAVVVGK